MLGPVKIINIDPPSLNVSGRIKNGAMINPVAGSNQGYDNSITAYGSPLYVSSLNAARPNGNDLSASNSLILQPGSSLVSVISYDVPQGIVYLRTAAILTILQSPAVEGSFRPPYSGNDKNVK